MKYQVWLILGFFCLSVFFIGSARHPVFAQGIPNKRLRELPTPTSEDFSATSDLLAPWRGSKCALKGSEILHHLCVNYVGDQYVNNSVVTLYNSDGTIWRKLELNSPAPDYYQRTGINDFVPFSTGLADWSDIVILRMIGESPNWYKVEINESTRATKFARRNDKAWSRTNWEGWLYYSTNLYLDNGQAPLMDAPNGKIIAASESIKFERVHFLRADGDWAYVEGFANPRMPNPERYKGWLRWREGRKILVGCYFNGFKTSETLPFK